MELGVMEAHLGLGELYLAGNGLGRNAQAGMRHLALASAAGIPEAQYKLGMAYYLGLGGEVDPIQANRWLREALKNGYKDAIAPLSMIKIA
jgi:TPR repeat protein